MCQMALHEIGEHDYVTGTPGYDACELYFRQTFLFLLKRFDWSFARRRVALRKVDAGWLLPEDCLHVVELAGLRHWRKYGQVVVAEDCSPDEPVTVVYTSAAAVLMGCVPDVMPDFAQVLVYHLAAAICGCVSGDEHKRQELLSKAEVLLREAMLRDACQDASNDQHPLEGLLNNSITA